MQELPSRQCWSFPIFTWSFRIEADVAGWPSKSLYRNMEYERKGNNNSINQNRSIMQIRKNKVRHQPSDNRKILLLISACRFVFYSNQTQQRQLYNNNKRFYFGKACSAKNEQSVADFGQHSIRASIILLLN